MTAGYVSEDRILEAIKALKAYLKHVREERGKAKALKNVKKALLLEESEEDDKLVLQLDFKKIFPNMTTYVCRIGPLPHSWILEGDADFCFIVRDLDPKNFLPDRELDLQLTRSHYKKKLEEAGFDSDFLNQRVQVMPNRELIQEYKTHEAKNRLCSAYDLFLVERKLMNNKFKRLNLFMGSKFWVVKKKTPIPIRFLDSTPEELHKEIVTELKKVSLVVTGRGATASVTFGTLKQSDEHLAENLRVILDHVKGMYKYNVATLRIKTPQSISLPIYVDLGNKNEVNLATCCPSTKRETGAIVDEFPMFNNTDAAVYPDGTVRLIKKDGEPDDPQDKHINQLQEKWLKITNPRKRKGSNRMKFGAKRRKPSNKPNRLTKLSTEAE